MTEDQKDLLIEARQSLTAAELLLRGGFPGFAASRAYYAMFYVAEAFLEGAELSFSKHSAVIAAFGREFAHKGVVPAEFLRFLIDAQELRFDGDYHRGNAVTAEQAHVSIERARQFLVSAVERIGPIPPEACEAE